MSLSRRQVLSSTLFGAGAIGLRALATGLPIPFLLTPARADDHADRADPGDDLSAQYLILSTSSAGDPVNGNVPGTYDFPDIVHPADPAMAKTALRLGERATFAAAPWATLPQAVLDRTLFFHHATLTNKHPNLPKVMGLGAADGEGVAAPREMLPSVLAKHLSARLQTVQREPLSIGGDEVLSFDGRPLTRLSPTALREALTRGRTPLVGLPALRDAALDRLHAELRQHGTRAQRDYLDRRALSRPRARALGEQILDGLAAIKGDQADGQVIAAAALIRMNVAPVVALSIPFGGDNHFDDDLASEAQQTVSGVRRIRELMARLDEFGLTDRASFAMVNVFGRTLKRLGRNGRDHWARHHAAVIIGRPFRAGIVGGLAPYGDDYAALGIRSHSGAGSTSGDIPFAETLGALGKTLGRGLGLPEELLDQAVPQGKVVRAALVG